MSMIRTHVLRAVTVTVALFAVAGSSAHASSTDGFLLGERFNNAIEAVQQGIDVIWPGDFNSDSINARLGFGMGAVPDYVGSNSSRFLAIPILDIRYKDVWRLNGSRFTYSAFQSGSGTETGILEVGPLISLNLGRNEGLSENLEGLGDINVTLDVGGFASYRRKSLLLELDVRQALGAGQGLQIRATAGHGLFKRGNFGLGFGIRARYLNQTAMQTNFGITEVQSARSAKGFEAFETGSGVSDISANLIGALRLSERVRLLGLVSFGRLFGDAADSPLVKDGMGSRTQIMAGGGLTIQF